MPDRPPPATFLRVFGVSFLEIAVVGLVALIVVGPQKLPEMMRTAGEWLGKLRRMTADMRAQTGIDDILREEGIDGVHELRTLLRGERGLVARRNLRAREYEAERSDPDPAIEFPVEGPDAFGALPDDLLSDDTPPIAADVPKVTEPTISQATSAALIKASAARTDGLPSSIPPPPATPRVSPPRAVTHRETPHSKSEPKITISEPPPRSPTSRKEVPKGSTG